jgi:hypothetical protein
MRRRHAMGQIQLYSLIIHHHLCITTLEHVHKQTENTHLVVWRAKLIKRNKARRCRVKLRRYKLTYTNASKVSYTNTHA